MAVMIDGPMITKFIENLETFEKFATTKFELINENREKKAAESMALDQEESHEDEFEAVDLESYKTELKEMMKAVAQGIGNTPVSILVEEGSVLLKVYEVEIVRIKKEKEEEEEEEKMKKMKKIEEERESNKSLKKGEVMASKKIKKKNSFEFLNFCACSGKQFVENN